MEQFGESVILINVSKMIRFVYVIARNILWFCVHAKDVNDLD